MLRVTRPRRPQAVVLVLLLLLQSQAVVLMVIALPLQVVVAGVEPSNMIWVERLGNTELPQFGKFHADVYGADTLYSVAGATHVEVAEVSGRLFWLKMPEQELWSGSIDGQIDAARFEISAGNLGPCEADDINERIYFSGDTVLGRQLMSISYRGKSLMAHYTGDVDGLHISTERRTIYYMEYVGTAVLVWRAAILFDGDLGNPEMIYDLGNNGGRPIDLQVYKGWIYFVRGGGTQFFFQRIQEDGTADAAQFLRYATGVASFEFTIEPEEEQLLTSDSQTMYYSNLDGTSVRQLAAPHQDAMPRSFSHMFRPTGAASSLVPVSRPLLLAWAVLIAAMSMMLS